MSELEKAVDQLKQEGYTTEEIREALEHMELLAYGSDCKDGSCEN